MPTWPFTRGRPSWASGNRITAAIAELWDSQLSQAADGSVYSDIALVQNWVTSDTTAGLTVSRHAAWDANRQVWLLAGDTGADPEISKMYRSGVIGAVSDPAAGLVIGARGATIASGGNWVVGGNPTGSSAVKIRYSADGGASWNSGTMNVGGTSAVVLLHTFAGLVIAGLDNGDIETSDTGATWTARTEPNTDARKMAASSDDEILITSSASTDKLIRSTNGTTWAEQTLPASGVWYVAWSEAAGQFLALSATDGAKSATGVTWSATGVTHPGAPSDLACIGHVFLAVVSGNVYASVDVGATWRLVHFTSTTGHICVGDQQVLIISDTGNAKHDRSWALGGR